MLYTLECGKSIRLVVISYDIASPRRARAVRKILLGLSHTRQYSVYELLMGNSLIRDVLAEVSDSCDFTEDRLAVWWPWDGQRLIWQDKMLRMSARMGQPCHLTASLPRHLGNFIVCYDISDPDTLQKVARQIAAESMMIQRSVYWLRSSFSRLSSLLADCAPLLTENDRLWAYPLAGCHLLWRIGEPVSCVLPISTHRWEAS